MPTFSPMQLDRLIESRATTATSSTATTTTTKTTLKNDNKNLPEDSFPKLERRNTTSSSPLRLKSPFQSSVDIPPSHPNIRRRNSISVTPHTVRPPLTPALYTTPEPTPLPVSPTSSFPPSSPFLINHKRRGPRLSKSFSEQNVALTEKNAVEVERTRSLSEENVISDLNLDKIEGNNGDDVAVAVVVEKSVGEGEVKGSESEDFYDPQESMSYSSSNEVDEFGGVGGSSGGGDRSAKAITPMGEFYDAWEELSSDSGQQAAQRSLSDVETELREMRLSLLMEIEKRKHVEEAAQNMQSKWQMLREKLHSVGIALPANLAVLEGDGQSDVSLSEDICRQIHVARLVSESIGQGIVRAEVEAEMEAQLEVKNFEIARLCDRLHYYETMNREMSQRNQEAVEIARRDRHKRRRRQKWVWGSIATAITLGSAALAWSYLPKGSPSTKTLEASKPGSDMN